MTFGPTVNPEYWRLALFLGFMATVVIVLLAISGQDPFANGAPPLVGP